MSPLVCVIFLWPQGCPSLSMNHGLYGKGKVSMSLNPCCTEFINPLAPGRFQFNYTPASTKLIGGYTGITLSVCPSVRLSVCPSVDRIVSALYLQQYSSDPFHICTSYLTTLEGVPRVMPVSKFKNLKFWRIFKICNFDFVIFWLGILYDSMVWVIMRRRGVSSGRRHSSCSSFR